MFEDYSESVLRLSVLVVVDAVGGGFTLCFFLFLGILNACSLILICVLLFGELVLCASCCGSLYDRDRFLGNRVANWSSSMKSCAMSKFCS